MSGMARHYHEKWQIQDGGAGPYCAACGESVSGENRVFTRDELAAHPARRDHEVFSGVIREWPEWQRCQHGKRCVEVRAWWADTAPWRQVTAGTPAEAANRSWFTRIIHTDGTPPPLDGDGRVTTFEYGTVSRCPTCGGLDTLTTKQEAWADVTTCTQEGCDYTYRYSIGD